MSRKCMGCGSVFQSEDSKKQGYVRQEKLNDAVYCERCFRLKHYHERKLESLSISNEDILKCAERYSCPIYYFIDLLNLSEESIRLFRRISGVKFLVLTKIDYIPKSISISNIMSRIRLIYDVHEEIIPVSIHRDGTMNHFWNHISSHSFSQVVFLGMTNVGKSSLLNQLSFLKSNVESPILVSEMPNTTREFISWKIQDITIYDAPGFSYEHAYDGDLQFSSAFKKWMHPITHSLKKDARLYFHSSFTLQQDCVQNYVTFYGSNEYVMEKLYRDIPEFTYEETICFNDFQDLVFPGVGFFQFRSGANVTIRSAKKIFFEVRRSLLGGKNDTN